MRHSSECRAPYSHPRHDVSPHFEQDAEYGQTYVAMATKVAEKGVEYIEKELKRLEKMAASASIAAEKKTGFLLKANVLKAFAK